MNASVRLLATLLWIATISAIAVGCSDHSDKPTAEKSHPSRVVTNNKAGAAGGGTASRQDPSDASKDRRSPGHDRRRGRGSGGRRDGLDNAGRSGRSAGSGRFSGSRSGPDDAGGGDRGGGDAHNDTGDANRGGGDAHNNTGDADRGSGSSTTGSEPGDSTDESSLDAPVTDNEVLLAGSNTGAVNDVGLDCDQFPPACLSGITRFGSIARGSTRTITFTVRSALDLKIGKVSIDGTDAGDFLLDRGGCTSGTTIAKDRSCTLQITFGPTANGTRKAVLIVTREDGGTRVKPWGLEGKADPTA